MLISVSSTFTSRTVNRSAGFVREDALRSPAYQLQEPNASPSLSPTGTSAAQSNSNECAYEFANASSVPTLIKSVPDGDYARGMTDVPTQRYLHLQKLFSTHVTFITACDVRKFE